MTDKLFYLVEKNLKRLQLSEDKLPTSLESWHEFLNRINRAFYDFEQERYLLERSMEISSREMLELNEKFEHAQETAHIGLWIYDRIENRVLWSPETFRLFGFETNSSPPSLDKIMALVHEKDRSKLQALIERAFKKGEGYDNELQIKNIKDNNYHWVYMKGNVQNKNTSDEDKNFRYLTGIIMDISKRKEAEKKLEELQKQLLVTARQAGMSEIATSILHNVGNILNSVNVSIAMLSESLNEIHPENLYQVSQLIKQNIPLNIEYFSQDKKGKLLITYLEEFSKNLEDKQKKLKSETEGLNINIQHIKNIVNTQKHISGVYEMKEKVDLNEAITYAISLGCSNPEQKKITILKKCPTNLEVKIDKAKFLQILVNLIKNSKESLLLTKHNDKQIVIEAYKTNDDKNFEILIKDNGVGIENSLINQIFSLGFTTKPDGHGFGLHSSANAAAEMHGSLRAESQGLNKGASFFLNLPC